VAEKAERTQGELMIGTSSCGNVARDIIKELMPSPLIPLEALLNLRRLLDSLLADEADSQQMSQGKGTESTETTISLAPKSSTRRPVPQARNSTDEFQFFQ
jgi:hypothetical protein